MKVDGALFTQSPSDAGPAALELERLGYDGAYTFEGPHDPFLPLCVAAEQTDRIELATAIAVAFARSPMLLANLGYDLQLQSKGRFILGLGSQIRPHITRRFSMPWSRPADRMRELVLAIRAIWSTWETGERLDFRGELYTHTLMTPMFNPGPNPFGLPRIFVAGVGPRMTEVAGEVADGFFVHPFHTREYVDEMMLPALARGRSRRESGGAAPALEISAQVLVVSGRDDAELERARDAVKMQVSFYASTPAYRVVLDSLGRGKLQEELNTLSKQGRWGEMAERVDDDLLERIAVCAPPERLAAAVRERCGDYAQRVLLTAPYQRDASVWADVVRELRASA